MKSIQFIGLTFLFAFLFQSMVEAQTVVVDTARKITDSSLIVPQHAVASPLQKLLDENIYLNSKSTPVSLAEKPRIEKDEDSLFYILMALVLFFGIVKATYPKYFSNLFRVFFNTSLRLSQLTDQLVQDQLPSLLYNSFFVINAGLFVYFLMGYKGTLNIYTSWQVMGFCILLFAIVYLFKYLILLFTGWITGFKQEAGIYTFIIFLINKIIGICLFPVLIVIAFADQTIAFYFVWITAIVISLLLLMRFIRSYGLLQNRIKISRFHFLLYIIAVEILPIFVIYKSALIFLNKKW